MTQTDLSDLSLGKFLEAIGKTAAQCLKIPPRITLSEWADTYRYIPSESGSINGRWRTSYAPYQKEMMDAISDPLSERVVIMCSAQIGKSELLLNTIGYYIHQEPCNIAVVQASGAAAQGFSKERFSPMVRVTPVLRDLVADNKSKETSSTVRTKQFVGGFLNFLSGSNPSELRSRPVKIILLDEVDAYPLVLKDEGDPVTLAIKRTEGQLNPKVVLVSTPTEKETSKIYAHWLTSDQRKYAVRCVHCEEHFIPKWSEHVRWHTDEQGVHHPSTALLHCPHCGGGHNDAQRSAAVRYGKWIVHNPASKIPGFHTWAIVSKTLKLENLVTQFLNAQGSIGALQTFVNTQLGEEWEADRSEVADIDFDSRLEDYELHDLPNNIAVVTAGVDVQQNRIEVATYGFAPDNEIYHLETKRFYTDNIASSEAWDALTDFLKTQYKRSDGTVLPIARTAIDSGFSTLTIYEYVKKNQSRGVYAIKGDDKYGPLWPLKSSDSATHKGHKVWVLSTYTGKDFIYNLLRNDIPGANYIHFSNRCDSEYFAQLTCERKVVKFKRGYKYFIYDKPDRASNEAFDCFIYALAVKESLGYNLKLRLERQRQHIARNYAERESKEEQVEMVPQLAESHLAESDQLIVPRQQVVPRQQILPAHTQPKVQSQTPQQPQWLKNLAAKRGLRR